MKRVISIVGLLLIAVLMYSLIRLGGKRPGALSKVQHSKSPLADLAIESDKFLLWNGRFPKSADELQVARNLRPESIIDKWGRKYEFSIDVDESLTIISYGADGKRGGRGTNADDICVLPRVYPRGNNLPSTNQIRSN